MKKKSYVVEGTWWEQRELKYKDFLQVLDVISGQFIVFAANAQTLGELIDQLKKEKILPKAGAIILRRHTGKMQRALSYIADRHGRITAGNVIEEMTIAQVAEVLLDFFSLNLTLMSKFLNSEIASSAPSWMKQVTSAFQRGRNASTISEAETLTRSN